MAPNTVNGRQQGFTYIALLIGVAILGAALGAVAEVTQTMVQRDREKELLFIGNQFRQAINRYFANNRHYPPQLENLILDDHSAGIKRHLRKIYVDPMTGQAEWGTVKSANGQIVGVYSLSEAAPLKTAGFRLANADFEGKTKYSEWIFMAAVRVVPNLPTNGTPSAPPRGNIPSGFQTRSAK